MRHRSKSSKIKYQHTMVQGLRVFLEERIQPLDYVRSIIPGEIKPKKGASQGLRVKFKYTTKTGAKLLAYSPGAVQEIFVVTEDPEALKAQLSG